MSGTHPDLWEQLRAGGTVLGLARASGATGHRARELAVNDAFGMAKRLAEFGWDVRPHLPDREVLMRALRDTPGQRSSRADGRPFYNTFVEVDLRAECGLFLLLSCGSGKEVDDNCAQPFAVRAAELVRRIGPLLTFGKRFDRWVRRAWALGPLMLQLEEQQEAFVGDGRHGIMPLSALSSMTVFFTTNTGQQEADKLPEGTRNGMVARTTTRMVDGRGTFGLAHCPPPGLATARLQNEMRAGDLALFLDTAASRPDPSEVAYGLPSVTDDTGAPVDQVANVRWFLERFGRPEWPTTRLVRGLAARRFSTAGIRRQRGGSAHLLLQDADERDAHRHLRSLIDNLAVYRTGRWVCQLGVPGFDPVVIDNVLPPDGRPWASEQRFEEIDQFLQRRHASLVSGRAEMTFSGLRVEVNGEAAVLLAGSKHSGHNHAEPVYWCVRAEDYPDMQRAVGTRVRVPHRALAEAILTGLQDATDAPVQRLLPEDGDEELEVLHTQQTTARHHIDRLQRTQQALYQRLTATNDNGELLVAGALYADLQAQYNELAEQLRRQRGELETLTADIERFRQDRQLHGGAPEKLLLLLSTLRDPHNTRHRRLWHQLLDQLTITVTPIRHHGHDGTSIAITGRLLLNDGTDTYAVRCHTTFEAGAATHAPTRIDAVTRQLREGIPLQDSTVPRALLLAGPVAKHLNCRPHSFVAANITDPRILRLVMAIHHPDNGQQPDLDHLAQQHDEPLTLLQRIATLHDPATRRRAAWCQQPATKLACAYLIGAHNSGHVPYDKISPQVFTTPRALQAMISSKNRSADFATIHGTGYRIVACSNCGSHRRALLRIPEPTLSICLDCRHDRAGIAWPADPYQQYQVQPHADAHTPADIPTALTNPNQQPRTDAIINTLRTANQPLTVSALVDQLQQHGRTCDDRTLITSTLAHLHRQHRVTHTAGTWTLTNTP